MIKIESCKKLKKKILNYINRIFIGPLIRKLYKLSGMADRYKLLNINSAAIGHYTADVALFLQEKKLKKYNFIGVLLASRFTVSNEVLSKLWAKNPSLLVIESPILCFLLEYLKYYEDTNYDCSNYSAVIGRPPKSHSIFYEVDEDSPLISWDENLLSKAKILFEKNYSKIDINKIIVFHARDSYYDHALLNPNLITQSHRNSELSSYENIFFYLKSEGYSIFRIGEYLKNKKYDLDYHDLSNLKSFEKSLLEIYLTSVCQIFLGSASGPLNIAIIWRRPIFALNMLPYATLRQVPVNSMVVPKLLKQNGKLLSISEIFDRGYHLLNRDDDYVRAEIECISNSSADCFTDFQEFFHTFVKKDQISTSILLKSPEQIRYRGLCKPDSYDYSAKGLIPRHFLLKHGVLK
jgi:putative glycosyltransferase (TIGR04372 family)